MTRSALCKATIVFGVAALAAPAMADGFSFGFSYGDGPRYYSYGPAYRSYYAPYCDDVVVVRPAPRVYYAPRVYRYYDDCGPRVYYGHHRYRERVYYPAHRGHVRVYR